jgi:hypothetical protein
MIFAADPMQNYATYELSRNARSYEDGAAYWAECATSYREKFERTNCAETFELWKHYAENAVGCRIMVQAFRTELVHREG